MSAKRSTTQRGYGATHQRIRKQWEPKVKAGLVNCARCHQLIVPDPTKPGDGWDLDHTDDRTAYTGPAHHDCNRSAGGRNGAMVTNAKRSMTIREW